MSQVARFYDNFSETQKKSGVHKRHILIFNWLLYFGLRNNHKVLEVGAGVGTVTSLIASYLKNGKILANDISQVSIDHAKSRLKSSKNVSFLVGDIMNTKLEEKYNAIVLPDVIEHIPKELHLELFSYLHGVLEENGFVVINIPNPFYLEWVHYNKPNELQVIDQPLHIDFLSSVFTRSGFYISYMQSYSIWNTDSDYQIFMLKKSVGLRDFIPVPSESFSFFQRLKRKLYSFFGVSIYKLPV